MKSINIIAMIGLTLIAMIGCEKKSRSSENTDALKVAASTSIIADVVTNVADKKARVITIIPSGQSPHQWTPFPRDIALLEDVEVIFINGLGLEEGLVDVLEELDGPRIVDLSSDLEMLLEGHHHDEEEYHDEEDHHDEEVHHDEEEHLDEDVDLDPHVWFSPINVKHWTLIIAETLSQSDPDNAVSYSQAATSYNRKLDDLNKTVHNMISKLPEHDRRMVTDHNTFAYFAREYGFTIIGNIIPGLSDQAEPSSAQLVELIESMDREGAKALFIGETASNAVRTLAETAAKEGGRNLPVVDILTGSLAKPGDRGSDYLDFILYNTELICDALSEGG